MTHDKLNLWPFYHLTFKCDLTFNLPEYMFQMAVLLLKKKNFAKLFWNPCINVDVITRTCSITDHFIIWPLSVTLTFNLPEEMFQMALLLLKENNRASVFFMSMHKYRSFCSDKLNLCDFQVWYWPSTYLKNVSNGTSHQGQQLCQIILKSMHDCRSYGTHALTHA